MNADTKNRDSPQSGESLFIRGSFGPVLFSLPTKRTADKTGFPWRALPVTIPVR